MAAYASLDGTGPARAGGARCIVEAETTREPHHLRSARSLVALPVERDDPPAAVAAASLVPRRHRCGPASATERVHWRPPRGRLSLPRSRGSSLLSEASAASAIISPTDPSSTSAALRILLASWDSSPQTERTTSPEQRIDQKNANPTREGELAGREIPSDRARCRCPNGTAGTGS